MGRPGRGQARRRARRPRRARPGARGDRSGVPGRGRQHGRVHADAARRAAPRVVHAVDVGYGQLAWPLRTDERVVVHERTNVRDLVAGSLEPAPGLVVADLSFISLALVLPALVATATPDAELLLMVKPQFEVGRDKVGTGGVVRDAGLRADAVVSVVDVAHGLGRRLVAATASPLPGPVGQRRVLRPARARRARAARAGARRGRARRRRGPRRVARPVRRGRARRGRAAEAAAAGARRPAAQPTGAGGPR